MSVESGYKNRADLNPLMTKPLQSSLSQQEPESRTRSTFLSPMKERQRHERSKSRSRTQPISPDTPTDTVAELTAKASSSNKHEGKNDRRYSELKPSMDQHDPATGERRYSTPQLHLSAIFPQAFRNQKNHHHHPQRTNSKDESNTIHHNSHYNNAPVVTSFNQLGATLTAKVDPPFSLKSPVLPSNRTRINPSQNNELVFLATNENLPPPSAFIYEENPPEPRSAELFIIESHTPISVAEIYREHFFEYFHTNYYGEFDYEGPFIASLRCSYHKTAVGDVCEARAIIRTQNRNCNVSDIVNGNNENNILQMLFHKVNLPQVRTYGTIGDPKANQKLYLFDKTNDERFNCKIGVIYQSINQTDEYDIFSNDHIPIEMLDFLDFLADRVRLRGFPKYRGDLDIKDDLHGEHSYHTVYENHEIMFNIAPLVPSTKANRQCIERKGLVGNAFVCIVFQDEGAVFKPDFISGKVTQIYITVQPLMHDKELYYKVGIWRRNDITSIVDPPGGTYKADRSFLPYFLTLILNAVNVAIESPSLRTLVHGQRQRKKCEELRKLCSLFSLGPLPDFNPDIDSNHSQSDLRNHIQSDNSFSFGSMPTENVNSNPGRISPIPSKKKGFSRKIFNVFSSRSGSLSSSNAPSNSNINESASISSQPPFLPEAVMSLARSSVPLNKENITRQRSIKSSQAPTAPSRPNNLQPVSAQVSMPSISIINPLNSDNLTQNNLINPAALNVLTRNRSNSSPDDTANTNKFQSYLVTKITEERRSTTSPSSTSEDDDSSSDTSEDEKLLKRPIRLI